MKDTLGHLNGHLLKSLVKVQQFLKRFLTQFLKKLHIQTLEALNTHIAKEILHSYKNRIKERRNIDIDEVNKSTYSDRLCRLY